MKNMDYLSKNGVLIYKELKKHCDDKLRMFDIDHFELSMLANSLDMYSVAAKFCSENGVSMATGDNGYKQICPEYSVMKNEYQNILKHSAKFGLNPGDRAKFFKSLNALDEKLAFE